MYTTEKRNHYLPQSFVLILQRKPQLFFSVSPYNVFCFNVSVVVVLCNHLV